MTSGSISLGHSGQRARDEQPLLLDHPGFAVVTVRPTNASPAREEPVAVALYAMFLLALLLDIGGSFGIKYATSAMVALYVILSAIQLRLRVPTSFILIEGFLFGLAPLFFFGLAVLLLARPAARR